VVVEPGEASTQGIAAASAERLARGRSTGLVVVVVLVGAVLATAPACGPDERAAAAAAARDLQGSWSGDDGSVLVVETVGPASDVRCTVQRTSVPPAEQALVDRLADPAMVLPALVLGDGVDPLLVELVGGENVVVDGEVHLHVRAAPLRTVDGPTLRWHLQLAGDEEALIGSIVVTGRERRARPGDEDGAVDEATRLAVPARFFR
jgi:hypothetical protein